MNSVSHLSNRWLIAEYNQLTGKNIKKFSSRAAGEKQVIAARQRAGVQSEPAIVSSVDAEMMKEYGRTHCPHCGMHLNNGVGEHNQEVNGTRIKHRKHQFECLACGEEFGPAISKSHKREGAVVPRPAMAASMKLDRRLYVRDADENFFEFKNAYQMWRDNPTWLTSAQVDRLTATLYSAAKRGTQATLQINGRVFMLARVAKI